MCTVNLLSPSSRPRVATVAPSFLVDVQTRLFSPGGLPAALDAISRGLAGAPVSVLVEDESGKLGCIARHPQSAPERPAAGSQVAPILFENRKIGKLVCAHQASPDSEQAKQLAELGKLLGFFLGTRNASPGEGRPEPFLARAIEVAAGRAARHCVTTTLIGEAGSGKRCLARWLHAHSPRREAAFICLDGKYEAEALADRLAAAAAGTLYLADIDELGAAQQAKLLHALEERADGGLDLRLIASSTRTIDEALSGGRLIPGLAYRLRTMQITLPALRERRSELPELIADLLRRANKALGTQTELPPEALLRLAGYDWPGNLRQLSSCVEEIALAPDSAEVLGRYAAAGIQPERPTPTPTEIPSSRFAPIKLQRPELIQALERCGWVQAKAARLLNLTPRQIAYAIDKHGVELKRL